MREAVTIAGDDQTSPGALTDLPGLGSVRVGALARLGVECPHDLLWHLPRRYEDLRPWDGRSAGWAVVEGETGAVRQVGPRQEAELAAMGETVRLVFFHKPYLTRRLGGARSMAWWGELRQLGAGWVMTEPEPIGAGKVEWGLRPVYALGQGLSQKVVRRAIRAAMPAALAEEAPWMHQVHRPLSLAAAEEARRRLAEIEATRVARAAEAALPPISGKPVPAPKSDPAPFRLRADQMQALAEIRSDLARPRAMRRLLLGEVGSGKTAVALLTARGVLAAGMNAVMLVPTEALVAQHLEATRALCGDLAGLVALSGGGRHQEGIAGPRLLIATTAAFSEEDVWEPLGLVIVDEEQRFGVAQRQRLLASAPSPHYLSLTATPIPRTLAQMLSRQIGLSVLGNPYGRLPTVRLIDQKGRPRVYRQAVDLVRGGGQVLVICPRRVAAAGPGRPAAEQLAEGVSRHYPDLPLHLITGATPLPELRDRLTRLGTGESALVIGTSVLEVGLDLPEASLVVVEGADVFGLAQLHQMRGRVGRRGQTAEAVWVDSGSDAEASWRLQRAAQCRTGEEVASLDLELRGCGLLQGVLQHGFPALKALRLPDEMALLASAFSTPSAAGN